MAVLEQRLQNLEKRMDDIVQSQALLVQRVEGIQGMLNSMLGASFRPQHLAFSPIHPLPTSHLFEHPPGAEGGEGEYDNH